MVEFSPYVAYLLSVGTMSRIVNGTTLFNGRLEIGVYASETDIIWSTVDGHYFTTTEARSSVDR